MYISGHWVQKTLSWKLQRRATEVNKGMENVPYWGKIKRTWLFILTL